MLWKTKTVGHYSRLKETNNQMKGMKLDRSRNWETLAHLGSVTAWLLVWGSHSLPLELGEVGT